MILLSSLDPKILKNENHPQTARNSCSACEKFGQQKKNKKTEAKERKKIWCSRKINIQCQCRTWKIDQLLASSSFGARKYIKKEKKISWKLFLGFFVPRFFSILCQSRLNAYYRLLHELLKFGWLCFFSEFFCCAVVAPKFVGGFEDKNNLLKLLWHFVRLNFEFLSSVAVLIFLFSFIGGH